MASEQGSKLFREKSLARLQSPERLDQIMEVTTLADWIPLGALAIMVVLVILWTIFGRIPLNVFGQGELIFPRNAAGQAEVSQLAARAAGQVVDLRVKRGDMVRKGQLLAVIDLPDLRNQLEQAREKLSELEEQKALSEPLQQRSYALSQTSIAEQRADVRQKLDAAMALGPEVEDKQLASLHAQRFALDAKLEDEGKLEATLKKVRDSRRILRKKGLIADTAMLDADTQYLDAIHQTDDLKSQLRQLDAQQLDIKKSFIDNESTIADLKAQLVQLDTQAKKATLDNTQQEVQTNAAINAAQRQVSTLAFTLRNQGLITSDYDGQVLEIDAVIGQLVNVGDKIGAIQVTQPGDSRESSLQAVAYFAVADGKRIQPGMRLSFTPATVKQVEFGGITGTVTHVSAFEVSQQSAANMLSSTALASQLTNNGKNTIEVIANLDEDPHSPSGFKWSASKGPTLKMTAGTTGQMQVTVERRAPISLVLPFLRSMSGL